MKLKNQLIAYSALVMSACSLIPVSTGVKEGHFRVENTSYDPINNTIEFVYLMCHNKKPTSWIAARQYPAGHHNLWVKATFQEVGLYHSYREAYVNFDITLPEGGNYQLAHSITNDEISIWFQDVESHKPYSKIMTTALKRHKVADGKLRLQQCRSGSV